MSGFEIAGIVLGGFPILIEAAKPLLRYLQGAERWWHFRRDFMALVSTIEDESIAYSQNLELLLTPVDIDPEAKAILQEDPKSKLWHDTDIQAKLKGRVKSQYMLWFQRQLLEMREALSELHGMLPVSPDGKARTLFCSCNCRLPKGLYIGLRTVQAQTKLLDPETTSVGYDRTD
ncbi:hypothetical protein NW759_014346 [Fusarium solani]|nr:hypothetical protein NW759_014346 [Fusarium solani]